MLVKSERYFDLYDQVFVHHFDGVPLPEDSGFEIDQMARAMLDEWLKNPKTMADALGIDEKVLKKMTPDELIEYFKKRLKDQDGRHDGGNNGSAPVAPLRWVIRISSRWHAGGGRVPE